MATEGWRILLRVGVSRLKKEAEIKCEDSYNRTLEGRGASLRTVADDLAPPKSADPFGGFGAGCCVVDLYVWSSLCAWGECGTEYIDKRCDGLDACSTARTLPRECFHLPLGISVGRRFVKMVVGANLGKCVGAGTCSCAQIGAHLCFLFFFYVAPRRQSTLLEACAELERLGFLLPPSEE